MDLRRALFWHGRPFGFRLIQLVNFVVFKAMLKSASNYAPQWVNGHSGYQAVSGVMHIFFNIFMTTIFNWFVCIYDQDVSFEKFGTLEKEKSMQVPMSERYGYGRTMCNRWRFILRMLIFDAYALIVGFGIFLIFYYAQGPMNAMGKMYDVATYGVVGTIIVVYIHHLQVMIHVRNWTRWMVLWFCISILMLPLCCWIAQIGKETEIGRKSIFRQLLPSMQLNAVIFCTVGAAMAPLLGWMYIERLLLWPRFYTKE
jgi:hypothetical protein